MTDKDTSFGEASIVEINKHRKETGCDIMEAFIWYCDRADMDPADVVKKLPAQEIARIRQELIEGRYVRREVAAPASKLPQGG